MGRRMSRADTRMPADSAAALRCLVLSRPPEAAPREPVHHRETAGTTGRALLRAEARRSLPVSPPLGKNRAALVGRPATQGWSSHVRDGPVIPGWPVARPIHLCPPRPRPRPDLPFPRGRSTQHARWHCVSRLRWPFIVHPAPTRNARASPFHSRGWPGGGGPAARGGPVAAPPPRIHPAKLLCEPCDSGFVWSGACRADSLSSSWRRPLARRAVVRPVTGAAAQRTVRSARVCCCRARLVRCSHRSPPLSELTRQTSVPRALSAAGSSQPVFPAPNHPQP